MAADARRRAELIFTTAETIWRSENDGRLVDARLREIQVGQVMLAMADAVAQAVRAEREQCAKLVEGEWAPESNVLAPDYILRRRGRGRDDQLDMCAA